MGQITRSFVLYYVLDKKLLYTLSVKLSKAVVAMRTKHRGGYISSLVKSLFFHYLLFVF